MNPVLELRDVTISFPGHRVIDHLSLTLYPGEILALVGGSGCGKTLLSHAIMGMLPPSAHCVGTLLFHGQPLNDAMRQQSLALMPQTTSYLDPLLTIDRQLPLPTNALGDKAVGRYPFQCSGGMVRNAFLGLAYEKKAAVLIADEPTPGLDGSAAQHMLQALQDLAKNGMAVVLITHDLDLAMDIAHRVAVFQNGALVEGNHTPQLQALWQALPQNQCTPLSPLSDVGGETLEAKGVSFGYGKGKNLFENVNLSLTQGQSHAICAPSGYGKTTFAKVLSGYQSPRDGQVSLSGKALPKKGFCPVQLIAQHGENSVNPKWTLEQILNEGGDYDPGLLDAFSIPKAYLSRRPNQISGGELQRICIIRALKPQTKFLICDEMTTMLDACTQAHIWQVVRTYAATHHLGLLVITHNLHLARLICDKIIHFQEVSQWNS